jgi:hypothetical protein
MASVVRILSVMSKSLRRMIQVFRAVEQSGITV